MAEEFWDRFRCCDDGDGEDLNLERERVCSLSKDVKVRLGGQDPGPMYPAGARCCGSSESDEE